MKVVGMVLLLGVALALAADLPGGAAFAAPEDAKWYGNEPTRLDGRISRVRDRGKERLASANSRIAKNTAAINETTARVELVEQKVKDADDRIEEIGALSSALDFQRPLSGKTFRLGLGTAAFEGEAAFAIGLTAQKGAFDAAVGVSTTGDETMGKGSVGVSF
jgi:hypothetical protein